MELAEVRRARGKLTEFQFVGTGVLTLCERSIGID